jgi:hypothetical protein
MNASRDILRDRVMSHLGSRDVAKVLYGATVGLALVLALQGHPPGPGTMVGLVIGTALAIGLAELYAEAVSTEARTRQPVHRAELLKMAGEASAVVVGAGFPAVFFLIAAIGLIDTHAAFTLSKWGGLTLICGYGFLAGRLAGSSVWRALWHAALIGVIGVLLIAGKSLLH